MTYSPGLARSDCPFVSVIVPVRNDPFRVRRTVEALAAQDYPTGRYEIIVVDNASTPALSAPC